VTLCQEQRSVAWIAPTGRPRGKPAARASRGSSLGSGASKSLCSSAVREEQQAPRQGLANGPDERLYMLLPWNRGRGRRPSASLESPHQDKGLVTAVPSALRLRRRGTGKRKLHDYDLQEIKEAAGTSCCFQAMQVAADVSERCMVALWLS
jgi:hypothetical protein